MNRNKRDVDENVFLWLYTLLKEREKKRCFTESKLRYPAFEFCASEKKVVSDCCEKGFDCSGGKGGLNWGQGIS